MFVSLETHWVGNGLGDALSNIAKGLDDTHLYGSASLFRSVVLRLQHLVIGGMTEIEPHRLSFSCNPCYPELASSALSSMLPCLHSLKLLKIHYIFSPILIWHLSFIYWNMNNHFILTRGQVPCAPLYYFQISNVRVSVAVFFAVRVYQRVCFVQLQGYKDQESSTVI